MKATYWAKGIELLWHQEFFWSAWRPDLILVKDPVANLQWRRKI